jgi:uncharacterized damage-inducible protein DinB
MSDSTPGLQPEHALFMRELAVKGLRGEHQVTRRVIEAVPHDKGDYKPDPIVKSAIELAWHIVGAEHRFVDAVIRGGFDFTNTGRPTELRTSADIARWYAATFDDDMKRLAPLTAEQLLKPLDFRGLFKWPAVAYLQVGLNHSIHHRGQLSMYLRPMGAKVPPIYGESYDSALAKQAGV